MALTNPNYVPRPNFEPEPPPMPMPDWLKRLNRPLEFSPSPQGEPIPYHKRKGTPQEYWKSPVGPGIPGYPSWGTGGRPHRPFFPVSGTGVGVNATNRSNGWQDTWKNFRYQGV